VSAVDTWRVDDYDALSANFGLDNTGISGARVKAIGDLLLLRRNKVDELLGMSQNQSR